MTVTLIQRPLWAWRARDATLWAVTGQSGACVRATTATLTDLSGTTVTLVNNQPRFNAIDTNADSVRDTVVYAPGAATTDYLEWGVPVLPAACTLYVQCYNRGAPGATAAVAGLGSANPSLLISQTTSNTYQAQHHNGTTAVTSTSAAATSGQLLELRVLVATNGAIQICTTTNGGTEVAATASGANALAAAWGGASVVLRLAGGVSGNATTDDLLAASLWPGAASLALCRSVR